MPDSLQFTSDGLLPSGEYALTFYELEHSVLVEGPTDRDAYPNWDRTWRRKLLQNLGILVGQLRQVGITEIFVHGNELTFPSAFRLSRDGRPKGIVKIEATP